MCLEIVNRRWSPEFAQCLDDYLPANLHGVFAALAMGVSQPIEQHESGPLIDGFFVVSQEVE